MHRPREDLFSGPRLFEHEHRGRRGRDLPGGLNRFPDVGAGSHDLAVGGVDFTVEVRIFLFERQVLEDLSDDEAKMLR
jgi:hypothetical protein